MLSSCTVLPCSCEDLADPLRRGGSEKALTPRGEGRLAVPPCLTPAMVHSLSGRYLPSAYIILAPITVPLLGKAYLGSLGPLENQGSSLSCLVCSSRSIPLIAQAPDSHLPRGFLGAPPDGVLVLFAADSRIQVTGTIAATPRIPSKSCDSPSHPSFARGRSAGQERDAALRQALVAGRPESRPQRVQIVESCSLPTPATTWPSEWSTRSSTGMTVPHGTERC